MSVFGTLKEELLKPIYSKDEINIKNDKNLSTTSKESDTENNYISYDPFSSYTSNAMGHDAKFTNRKESIGQWRKAIWQPEVDEAVNEIVSEAIVFDEQEQVITLNLDDVDVSKKIKEKIIDSFEHILFMLDFNNKGEELFKKWYVDGQLNVESVYDNRKIKQGIEKLIVLSPFNIWKIKDPKTKMIKYVIKDEKPTNNYANNLNTAERVFEPEQLTQIVSGLWSADGKTPVSYLQKAIKPINQLSLLEDAVVIWHITRSPEKRVFYIDTGNLPKQKAEEYIKRLISKYRQKKIYNADTGSLESRSKSISILEDFWLPRNSQGKGTEIDTLQAQAGGMEDMQHIEYFVNKIYKALNIPRSRRSQDAMIQINNTIDVEKDEMKFFRFILKLRRRFNNLFVDLLKKDLLAKKVVKLADWDIIQEKIKFYYADSNPYSDIKKMQILGMRMESAEAAMGMVENGFFSKTWVRREILKQSEEEIEQIKKELEDEAKEGDEIENDNFDQNYQEPQQEPPQDTKQPDDAEKDKKPEQESKDLLRDEIRELVRNIMQEQFKEMKEMLIPENKTNTDIFKDLKEGDIITNGSEKLIYKNGKLEFYE